MKLQDCPPPSNPIFRRWRWYSLIYPRTMALKIISVHTRVEGSFTATCTGPIATVLSLPHGFQLSFFFLPGMRCGAPVETGVLSLGPMDSMSTKWTVYSSATGRQNGAVFSRFREVSTNPSTFTRKLIQLFIPNTSQHIFHYVYRSTKGHIVPMFVLVDFTLKTLFTVDP